jgi:regulator of protease activity HflC (stomatin/prohibitin superfamily)
MLDLRQYPTRNALHRFRLRLQKKIFVPERYVVPVKRDGFVVRLLGPGYHTFWRSNEELCEPVNISVQGTDIKDYGVQTLDRVQIFMDLYIRYQFIPTCCASESLSWMITQKPSQLRKMMQIRLEEAVQAVCGGYTADKLATANNWVRYNREIQRYLGQRIAHLGISLDQIDPVVIKGLRVPRRLAELYEDGISVEHVHGWTEPDLRKWREREYAHNESVRVVHVESDAYPPNVIVDMPYVENIPPRHANGKHV